MNDDLKQIFWIVVIGAIVMLLLTGCNKDEPNEFEKFAEGFDKEFESSVVPITTPEIVVMPEEDERKIPTLKEEYR
jgi:hypothetical protein